MSSLLVGSSEVLRSSPRSRRRAGGPESRRAARMRCGRPGDRVMRQWYRPRRRGLRRSETGARGLVRQIGRLPDPPRPTEQWRRLGWLFLAEEQLAPRRQRPRLEQWPLIVRGDLVELVDGLTGRLEVAGGDRDVDLAGRRRPRVARSAGPPLPAAVARARAIERCAWSTSPRASWRSASPGCAS